MKETVPVLLVALACLVGTLVLFGPRPSAGGFRFAAQAAPLAVVVVGVLTVGGIGWAWLNRDDGEYPTLAKVPFVLAPFLGAAIGARGTRRSMRAPHPLPLGYRAALWCFSLALFVLGCA